MNFFWHLLLSCCAIIPAALGYNLILGKGKILHFGSIGLSVMAGYSMFVGYGFTGNYVAAILIGLVCTGLVGILLAILALRLEPDGLGILSIAAHLALVAVVLNWTSLTRGALGITNIPRIFSLNDPMQFALAALVCAAAFSIFIWQLDKSSLGRELKTLGESIPFAEALGVNRTRVYIVIFLVSAVGTVISNLFFAPYTRLLHPNDYALPFLVFYVMVVVAGKPGSVRGTIVSAILLTLLKEGLRFVPLPLGVLGPLRLVLFGMILLGFTWVRRKEMFPVERAV